MPLDHFLSFLTVILSISYHVSVVVTAFGAFSHPLAVVYFISSEKCCHWGRKQSETIATGQTVRNPILSKEVWNSQALI